MAIWLDSLAAYLFGLKFVLAGTALLIAISSLDDFAVDIIFYARRLYRRQTVYRRHARQSAPALGNDDQQWVAILVPAWREAAVIEHMLIKMCDGLAYRRYRVFVGLYANDPDTAAAVAGARAQLAARTRALPPIVAVPLERDGPTCKADCLNGVYHAALRHERALGIRFAIFALHDAEDVVHPLELRVFNHLIPRKDMVQLPVAPLPRPWHRWVGGHYLDEFAESHAKDLVVRECLTGGVPSAGVGCAFSRRALRLAGQGRGGAPFNTASVTEDYDLALRLRGHGLRSAFVRMAGGAKNMQPVATREFFPSHFDAAVRQKSRWLLGIALQGWQSLGWRGNFASRYMLLRDRKALVTAPLNILAYGLAAQLLALWAMGRLWPGFPAFPALVTAGSVTAWLLWANLFFLVNRLAQRMICVWRVYGLGQALLSLPRAIVANIVNFAAVWRAVRLFRQARRRRQPVAWDKTAHEFPDDAITGLPGAP